MQRLKSKSLPFLSQLQGIFLNPNLTIFKSKRKTSKSPSPTFETVMKLQQCLDKGRVLRFHENFPIWQRTSQLCSQTFKASVLDDTCLCCSTRSSTIWFPLKSQVEIWIHNFRQRSTTGPLQLPPKQHFSQRFNQKKPPTCRWRTVGRTAQWGLNLWSNKGPTGEKNTKPVTERSVKFTPLKISRCLFLR